MPFTFTESQYNKLLNRVTALEEHHNDIAVALDRFITLDQLQELLVVIQTTIDDLETQLNAIESRVTAIEEEPLT
jgi:predicted  nucleic acid-binding Zn-ribbon protein